MAKATKRSTWINEIRLFLQFHFVGDSCVCFLCCCYHYSKLTGWHLRQAKGVVSYETRKSFKKESERNNESFFWLTIATLLILNAS